MSDRKNPAAVQVGQRIKQARRMAGFNTAAKLLEKIPLWSNSRLGNYEAGISLPSPDHVKLIADCTGVSPCWLMFGLGPIRASGRDLQAIRHQNLTYIVESLQGERGRMNSFYKSVGLSKHKCGELLNNPFSPISQGVVRKAERFLEKPTGWMDQQHVEADPLCAAFPEDMRRIMEIYSSLDQDRRQLFVKMAEAFTQ